MTGQPPRPKTAADKPGKDSIAGVALICLGLAAITLAVFGQAARFDFINLDDYDYVLDNPYVPHGLSFKGVVWAFTRGYASNWHPLTWISHMLDGQLYGVQPGGHHVTNVVIHTATVVLLFLALRWMTGATWRSAFVAAVFAVHPLRAESVAWVSERKDVLSGFFFVLTIWAYARWARDLKSQISSFKFYWLALLLFTLGLLSKPMLVTLPLVLLILDFWPLQRGEPIQKLVLEKLPFFALTAASCVATLFAQRPAMTSMEHCPLEQRLIDAALAARIYLVQFVYPKGLIPYYPMPLVLSATDGAMALLTLVVITAFAWGERKTRPWLIAGWAWYVIMLLPVIGIVQVGSQAHADRYTYLPEIGIALGLTWLAAEAAVKWNIARLAVGVLAVALLGTLVFFGWRQTGFWKNSETLWRHSLDCDPENRTACLNLGHYLVQKGRLEEAIALYRNALKAEPKRAALHNNLGNALREEGRWDEAIAEYETAVELKPNFPEAQFNLGKTFGRRGRSDEAIAHLRAALQIQPDFTAARINLGTDLLQLHQAGEAAEQFAKVLETRPNDASVHLDLGLSLFQTGRFADAKSQDEQALELNPDDAATENNLALILATCPEAALRDGNKAVELASRANSKSGGKDAIVLHTLAAAYSEAGRFSEAVSAAQESLAIAQHTNPGLADQLQSEIKAYQAGKSFIRASAAQGK